MSLLPAQHINKKHYYYKHRSKGPKSRTWSELCWYKFIQKKKKQNKSLSYKGALKSLENSILAKGNSSSESMLNATKVVHDLYNMKTNSYTIFQFNISAEKSAENFN